MLKKIVIVITVLLAGLSAEAGKVENVQAEVKKSCGKEISSADALKMVKVMYLSCTPGTKVDTDLGCKVECLKENSGAVVGG